MFNKAWLALLAALLFLGACAGGAQLVRVEMAPGYDKGPLQRVMVVGYLDQRPNRIHFENEFVKQFRAHGVQAVTSLAVLPKNKETNKQEIFRQAKLQKTQAIFVGFLIDVNTKTSHTPGYSQPFYRLEPGWGTMGWGVPGYSTEHQTVRVLTQLYDTHSQQVFWTAVTKIVQPKSVGEILDSMAVEVMSNLKKKGLVK
jgi:hypothetical protein